MPIADQKLIGILCIDCGAWPVEGEEGERSGHPRRCPDCKEEADYQHAMTGE